MTQDERWLKRYQDVMEFIEKNHKNPSRPRIEEQEKEGILNIGKKRIT